MEVVNPNTFKSNQTKRVFDMYHTITCRIQWIIYLLKCVLCKLQYIRKSDASFNIRLNNHWKDGSSPKAILACIHFRKEGHNFCQFTLIEQLNETENASKATLKLRLKQTKSFWILKLDTFIPKILDQELLQSKLYYSTVARKKLLIE